MDDYYKELMDFFAAWFPDADLEGLSDEQVVEEYIKTATPAMRYKVTAQCRALLEQPTLPLRLIAKNAWRLFETQEECRQWVEGIERKLSM
ncbi:MAG: contact-dependent growth inhibition system immunity protein [Prosthecobacter sp.]|nr:contact-dependent growth inhibition system immunity protein [Prosthecobacter sp.]